MRINYTVFDNKHLKEYVAYGGIAGLFFVSTVWYFLFISKLHTPHVLFIGSFSFMFLIMIYALRLTKRRSENYSIWLMIIAGQMAVGVGVVVSVIGSFILCSFHIRHLNTNNSGTLELIFYTAIIENYLAAAFISAIVAYAVKPDQTQDKTPVIFEEPADLKNL